MNRIPRFITLICVFLTSCLVSVQAQSAFSGTYTGTIYVAYEGALNVPETSTGIFLVTVDNEGNMRYGLNTATGQIIATVAANGSVTFSPPLPGAEIASGTITDEVLAGTNTIEGPLTQIYRLEATRSGDFTDPSETPPTIQFLTQSMTVNPNTTHFLTVSANPATAYEWYMSLDGSPLAIGGATSSSFTTPPITQDTVFWVRVYNGDIYTDSDEIRLTVNTGPSAPWEKIELPDPKSKIRAIDGDVWVASVVESSDYDSFAHISFDRGGTWELLRDEFRLTDAFLDGDVRLFIERNFMRYQNEEGELIRPSIDPFPGDIGEIVRLDNGSLFFASLQANGLFRSDDGGRTWTGVEAAGLPDKNATYYYPWAVGSRLLVGVSSRAALSDGGCFYSDDNGVTFTRSEGLPEHVFGPQQYGTIGGTLYGHGHIGTFTSADDGATWEKIADPSLLQFDAVVEGEQFYWAINGSLWKMGVDHVQQELSGDEFDHQFTNGAVYYQSPYLIAEVTDFGWYKLELEDAGNGGGGEEPVITTREPPMFNPASGLYDQWINFQTTVPLPRFELEVRGVPSNVILLNASRRLYGDLIGGQREIVGYVLTYLEALAANGDLPLNLQFQPLDPAETPSFMPQITVNTSVAAPAASTMTSVKTQRIDSRRASFVFPVVPGRTYGFRWSDNLSDWTELPDFIAAGSLWEWLAEFVASGRYFQLVEREF